MKKFVIGLMVALTMFVSPVVAVAIPFVVMGLLIASKAEAKRAAKEAAEARVNAYIDAMLNAAEERVKEIQLDAVLKEANSEVEVWEHELMFDDNVYMEYLFPAEEFDWNVYESFIEWYEEGKFENGAWVAVLKKVYWKVVSQAVKRGKAQVLQHLSMLGRVREVPSCKKFCRVKADYGCLDIFGGKHFWVAVEAWRAGLISDAKIIQFADEYDAVYRLYGDIEDSMIDYIPEDLEVVYNNKLFRAAFVKPLLRRAEKVVA